MIKVSIYIYPKCTDNRQVSRNLQLWKVMRVTFFVSSFPKRIAVTRLFFKIIRTSRQRFQNSRSIAVSLSSRKQKGESCGSRKFAVGVVSRRSPRKHRFSISRGRTSSLSFHETSDTLVGKRISNLSASISLPCSHRERKKKTSKKIIFQ